MDMRLFRYISSDFKKYKKYGGNFITIVFFTQGFWAILQYRVANEVFKMKIPLIKQILQIGCLFWQKIVEITTGISIPASVQVGHSFYIGHFGGIIMNARAVIGDNCNVSQGVTIGVSGQGKDRGVPIVGNNVYIGANAVLVGNIVVEDNVLIGANSLINKNVSQNAVMLGVPAVAISVNGSEGYI